MTRLDYPDASSRRSATAMRKLVAIAVFGLLVLAVLPARAAFVVQAKNIGTDSHHMKPSILIKTNSATQVDLKNYALGYYFYIANLPVSFPTPALTFTSSNPPAGTTITVKTLPDTYTWSNSTYANWMVEIKFTQSKLVNSNSSVELNFDVQTSDLRPFYEGDDWSFVSSTTYVQNNNITLTNGTGIQYGTYPKTDPATRLTKARAKIKHVFVIMQENRSFDHYFGSFKGVDGSKGLVAPANFACTGSPNVNQKFNPTAMPSGTVDPDFPHAMPTAGQVMGCPGVTNLNQTCTPVPAPGTTILNINNFLQAAVDSAASNCSATNLKRVVGYYDGDTPGAPLYNYWTLAKNFVLQDKMFEAVASYSKFSHLYMVSGWSANCTSGGSCSDQIDDWITNPSPLPTPYRWNDITTLLRTHNPRLYWYYIRGENWNPACLSCSSNPLNCFDGTSDLTHDYWEPLSKFKSVQDSGETGQVDSFVNYWLRTVQTNQDASAPVTWIVPGKKVSEHAGLTSPAVDVMNGQAYVTAIVQGIMRNKPLWESSAIFLSWDDWGGFYDHVIPPTRNGKLFYGPRVPGLVISPYIKQPANPDAQHPTGFIDSQVMSHDAYLKFIEDIFLEGSRIPAGDGRPAQRETLLGSNDLLNDFDFNRNPMPAPSEVLNLNCHWP